MAIEKSCFDTAKTKFKENCNCYPSCDFVKYSVEIKNTAIKREEKLINSLLIFKTIQIFPDMKQLIFIIVESRSSTLN